MKAIGRMLGIISFAMFGFAMRKSGFEVTDLWAWVLGGCMVVNTISTFMEFAFD